MSGDADRLLSFCSEGHASPVLVRYSACNQQDCPIHAALEFSAQNLFLDCHGAFIKVAATGFGLPGSEFPIVPIPSSIAQLRRTAKATTIPPVTAMPHSREPRR